MKRPTLAFGTLAAGLAFLLAWLARLQLVQGDEHRRERARRTQSFVDLRPARGSIYSADGSLLAASLEVSSIFADPLRLEDPQAAARWAAGAFGGDPAEWKRRFTPFTDPELPERRFVWVKRHETRAWDRLPKGIATIVEYRRQYPYGPAASALLGFADIDGRGQEGVERTFEAELQDRPRRIAVVVDAVRRPVAGDPGTGASRDGRDLRLTIDLRIQRILDEQVARAVGEHSPRSISAVALDVETGAVRALSVHPSFDPNRPGDADADARLNRVVTNPFEPGSTLKPLIAARALERGVISPDDTFDCPGARRVGPRLMRCHKTHGRIAVGDVIAQSCDVGAAEIALKLGPREIRALLEELGFGRRTGIELPAESRGAVTSPDRWNEFTTTSAAIGYEVSVTPLQLAVAMATLANGGRRVVPYCVEAVLDDDGHALPAPPRPAPVRVHSEEAARQMREMMARVVTEGTGTAARVEGLEIFGKTGTTQKLDPATGRYRSDAHIGTFVGSCDGLLVVFSVDGPRGEAYYGGTVAAPFVGKFFERVRGLDAASVQDN
jgi:cell division protein FtsI/penicillin-binding protein 2